MKALTKPATTVKYRFHCLNVRSWVLFVVVQLYAIHVAYLLYLTAYQN